mmetsp:Transcript_1352/g.1224  ORF Transcript_1352/g.1224 Transcript_1352/m.1224 type:complete len:396 (+) Transcript_1352:75-1262(+)
MKSISALLFIGLIATAFAAETTLQSQLEALMSVKAQAMEGTDSALDYLYLLIQNQHDEQAAHDAKYAEQKARLEKRLAELAILKAQQREECDNSHAHTQFIQDEITDTETHLEWITNRRNTLNQQREDLKAQRCEAAFVFVRNLKEHYDGLEVINFLRSDLNAYQNSANSFAEVSSGLDRLMQYAHLFNTNELNSFIQLADPKTEAELTDGAKQRTAEQIGDDYKDNDREALKLKEFDSDTEERNIQGGAVGKILALLDKLEARLHESIENLKENEIRAAYDLANWLDKADDELAALEADEERKNKYLAKLEVDLEVAERTAQECEERYQQTLDTIAATEADLQAKTDFYHSETERRNGEIEILEECIRIFKSKVQALRQTIEENAAGQGSERLE